MSRRTWIAVVVAAASVAAAVLLYLDNRRLEREVAALRARADAPAADAGDPWAGAGGRGGPGARDALEGVARGLGGAISPAGRPSLPDADAAPRESRLDRRVRRQQELAALLGRQPGESDEAYRERVLPLVELGLARPRENVTALRAEAEAAAGVTTEQRAELDAAFEQVYDELLTYTNAAIADGQLSPYERNVAGLLDYAGGLGAILQGAERTIGTILGPDQIRRIYDSGFEWGEYLGVSAPWERLQPPPPPTRGGSGG